MYTSVYASIIMYRCGSRGSLFHGRVSIMEHLCATVEQVT